MTDAIQYNLYQQLRIKGWVVVAAYALPGLLLNGLKGLDITFCVLMLSLVLLNGFSYIFNDYHDAPFDKLDPKKRKRNLFCGEDKRKLTIGRILLYATPSLSILLAFFTPFRCAIWILVLLVLGYLYSSPVFRAKERPFWDWFIHILMVALVFVPGYLYFFKADLVFYALFVLIGTLSLINQINNEYTDFEVDSLSKHRTTVIVLGKRKTFFLRWMLEIFLVGTMLWIAVRYRFFAVAVVLITTFLIFSYVERIKALDKIEILQDHMKIRIGNLMFVWQAVWLMEGGIKLLK